MRVEKQNVKMQIALRFILIRVAFLIVNRSLRVISQIEEKKFHYNCIITIFIYEQFLWSYMRIYYLVSYLF